MSGDLAMASASPRAPAARRTPSPLRVLVFSTLYPSAVRPRHGIFVETRIRELLKRGGVEVQVIAPVPWFPSRHARFKSYAQFAATPRLETRHGIAVHHPRYFMWPGAMTMQPHTLALAGLRAAQRIRRGGFHFDVIDAHYLYPDAVAAGMVARRLGVPFVATARGSDVNAIAEIPAARARMLDMAAAAARVLCVSGALRQRAVALGMGADHVEVLRNGVDTALFDIGDRTAAREALAMVPRRFRLIVSVGNLAPEKGHSRAVEALKLLPDSFLLLVGEGSEAERLRNLARELGVLDRMAISDAVDQTRLAPLYRAADALLLPSLREGWPNVLLEAMACGTPVVATDVGGVREIVVPEAGRVVAEATPRALATALEELLGDPPPPERVRRHALKFGWESVAVRHREVLASAAAHAIGPVESGTCATC